MRELTVGKNDAGQRLDRFVGKSLPLLPPALLQKYIRIKRIKLNGQRAARDQRLAQGDVLQLYINETELAQFSCPPLTGSHELNVVFLKNTNAAAAAKKFLGCG